MRTIELKVNNKIADAFARMDSVSREKLTRKLEEYVSGKSRLMLIVREMQREANKTGLTQEKLDEILNGD